MNALSFLDLRFSKQIGRSSPDTQKTKGINLNEVSNMLFLLKRRAIGMGEWGQQRAMPWQVPHGPSAEQVTNSVGLV